MSQGALDRERFEAIEAYLLGTMPLVARERFEAEMAQDADLRAEVRLQMENTLAIELGGVQRVIATVAREHAAVAEKVTDTGNGWKQYLKYAAVVAIVLSGAFWMLSRPSTNERIYAEYYAVDPGLPVAMSATTDHAFHDAMVAYKLGDHQEAVDKWLPLLQVRPTSDTLRFYIASAYLAMDNSASATPLFAGLAADTSSAFMEKARWYLFLAYVKAGDRAKAAAVPLDGDATYGERARAIKAQLE